MKKMMKMPAMAYVILLLSMTAGVACNRDDGPKEDKEPEFTGNTAAYPLNGTMYRWKNINHDEKLIVVNSYTELENYFVGTDYPVIDFSQSTLLLTSGGANKSVHKIVADFVKDSEDEYLFNVSVMLGIFDVTPLWMFAEIVPVVVNEEQVKLNIQHVEPVI